MDVLLYKKVPSIRSTSRHKIDRVLRKNPLQPSKSFHTKSLYSRSMTVASEKNPVPSVYDRRKKPTALYRRTKFAGARKSAPIRENISDGHRPTLQPTASA